MYVHIHCSSEKTTPYICQIPTKLSDSVEYIFLIILVLILAKARYVALKYSVCRMQKVEPFDCCCSHQWRRRLSACVRAHGVTVDILCTFCDGFMVQFVKFMLIIFEFGVWLFDCFVYRQNVTCLKRFTRYGHYAGEVRRHRA